MQPNAQPITKTPRGKFWLALGFLYYGTAGIIGEVLDKKTGQNVRRVVDILAKHQPGISADEEGYDHAWYFSSPEIKEGQPLSVGRQLAPEVRADAQSVKVKPNLKWQPAVRV
jgi:hypothetical protein